MKAAQSEIEAVLAQINRVILGKDAQIRLCVACLLARGHLLIEDIPGVGKTTLAHAIAKTLGLSFQRVQFTSDLLPADVLGVSIYDRETGKFRFQRGPIFAQLVLADEINRASPKAQSALLEAMEEHQVTLDGQSMPLPEPFFVIATQNPIEQEGTYPLPEAQLDRFLLEIDVGYPALEAERTMLLATTGTPEAPAEQAMTSEELRAAQALIRRVPVGDTVVDAILSLVRGGRPETADEDTVRRHVAWGPGPRAAQALMLASRARALLGGRLAPSIDDVIALARPVLRHRMALNFSARADGVVLSDVIDRLVERLA